MSTVTVALLQGIINPATIWILIPLTALAIPIVAILVRPMTLRMQQSERERARKLYERIVLEKLDVIKTAVAMGHNRDELAGLDARLERLVGADKLASLLSESNPAVPATPVAGELLDTDLDSELDALRRPAGEQRES